MTRNEPFVPDYTVQVTDELTLRVREWPQERQDSFFILAGQLGSTFITRTERHGGGRATFVKVGNFHMTYVADYDTKIITVTDGADCTHANGECRSQPNWPYPDRD